MTELTDAESRALYPELYGKWYTFFRENMFYMIELGSDEQAIDNVHCNPGTTKVEDVNGNIVWVIN